MLLGRVQAQRDYPLLPATMGQVLPLASSDRQKLTVLSEVVMMDMGLSFKLLRMVNSSLFSGLGQGAVSTVSTAIQLLGFAAVRSSSTAMAAITAQKESVQRARLLDDSLLAAWCGTVAAALSGLRERDAEEAFVCGSLQWLGPMLLSHCFATEALQLETFAPLGGQSPFGQSDRHAVLRGHRERASRHVLGVGLEALAIGAARHWGLPEILVQSLPALAQAEDGEPTGNVAITHSRAEYLRALANCAHELLHAWLQTRPERLAQATGLVLQRYGAALGMSAESAQQAMGAAAAMVKRQLLAQSQSMRQDLPHSLLAQRVGLAGRPAQPRLGQASVPVAMPVAQVAVAGRGGAGVAFSLQVLDQGMERVATQLAQGQGDLNRLLQGLLQTLQEATGFERVMLVLREARGNQMTGRIAVGPMVQPAAAAFSLALDDAADPFAAIVREAQDQWIADASQAGKRPAWHRQHFQTGAYLILPLVHKGQVMGLIYADHTRAGAVVLTGRVLARLGQLRDQAVQVFARHSP